MKISNIVGGVGYGVNTQTGTAYTLALSDAGAIVRANNAGAVTVTVPLNAAVAFDVGTAIEVTRTGAGTVTVAATVGVTIQSAGGLLALSAQHGVARLVKVATDTWLLSGDLA